MCLDSDGMSGPAQFETNHAGRSIGTREAPELSEVASTPVLVTVSLILWICLARAPAADR